MTRNCGQLPVERQQGTEALSPTSQEKVNSPNNQSAQKWILPWLSIWMRPQPWSTLWLQFVRDLEAEEPSEACPSSWPHRNCEIIDKCYITTTYVVICYLTTCLASSVPQIGCILIEHHYLICYILIFHLSASLIRICRGRSKSCRDKSFYNLWENGFLRKNVTKLWNKFRYKMKYSFRMRKAVLASYLFLKADK